MATNQILNIPEWLLVGSVSQPTSGYSKIYPKLNQSGLTGSWYVTDDVGTEKRLALDIEIGAGISFSYPNTNSPYGTRIDIALGGGLTYSQGVYSAAPISVWGITPSMLSITGSFNAGYFLSTSTVSGEFQWSQVTTTILGPTHTIPRFDGTSLTNSRMVDTGTYFYIGSTPSTTNATFSVDNSINIAKGNDGYLYFGDQLHNYVKGEWLGGMVVRTQDEFIVEHYTSSSTTFKVIDFDNLGDENRTLKFMDSMIDFGSFTSSKYLSASNVNRFTLGKTQSTFILELISGSQGAIKIQDGGQGSYSVLYSDSSGIGQWGKIYGYNGLTSSGLGVGFGNLLGLTYSGSTVSLDYSRLQFPLTASVTGTISIATVSVITGVTYGSVFETPTFRLDAYGRIIQIATVSTSAFTGPQGPTGTSFVWYGNYTTSSTYTTYDVINFDGSSYVSITSSNTGRTPSTATMSWNLMVSKGATGSTGTGFTWFGTYSNGYAYTINDVINYDGSSYISVTTSNFGFTPSTSTASWNLMASKGDSFDRVVGGTYGAVLIYGEYGWTALGPATAGYVLTSGGTSSLPYWSAPVAGSPSLFTFSQGFTVSLNPLGLFSGSGNQYKTFGKYKDGDWINAVGMTIEQFIYDVVTEVKGPIVNLNITIPNPNQIDFGATNSVHTLSYNYTIQNIGAVVSSAELSYRTDNFGDWTVINTDTGTPGLFVHTVSIVEYQVTEFNYRYTVVDSLGGSNTAFDNIGVDEYVSPTLITDVTAKTKRTSYGETELKREYGNVGSNVILTYTRNSPLINVTQYTTKYRIGTGAYNTIYGPLAASNPITDTISQDHTTTLPVSNSSLSQTTTYIDYQHNVEDEYTNTNSTFRRVTFEQLFFYGPTSSEPTNRAQLLTMPNVKLSSAAGSPFTFTTGTILKNFVIAIPTQYTISRIDAIEPNGNETQIPLTGGFVTTTTRSVDDFAGNPYNYQVYYYTIANPYNPSVTWRITYS